MRLFCQQGHSNPYGTKKCITCGQFFGINPTTITRKTVLKERKEEIEQESDAALEYDIESLVNEMEELCNASINDR